MTQIMTYDLGAFAMNCYMVKDEERHEAIIIDPGTDAWKAVQNELGDCRVTAILLTHAHLDHIDGLKELREETGAPVYLHEAEQDWLKDPNLNGSARWPQMGLIRLEQPAEQVLQGGEKLSLLGTEFEVLHTPGHSPGSVSYVAFGHCFAGDALFAQSIGRTDLLGGNHEQLIRSIREKLLVLPNETAVHPGHGPSTTIGAEKKLNPFLR